MDGEFVGFGWTAGRIHVCRTREEAPGSPGIVPDPPHGLLRRPKFEELLDPSVQEERLSVFQDA
jgi:hypothetical protein